jgi:hypothetical protein
MARNRKTQSAAAWFRPAVSCGLVCLLLGGSGVGYVWQTGVIKALGQQISQRERQLADLNDQNEKLRKQLGYMRSPRYLEARIKELNLGLTIPQPAQILRLNEPVTDYPDTEKSPERHYAASGNPSTAVR